MSFKNSMMEFFGLGAYSPDDDAYYDDPAFDDRRSDSYSRSNERYAGAAPARSYDDYAERESRSYREEREASIISVRPRNYNDAKDIGEPFRDGDAVVMDLSGVDKPTAMRLIDFAAGLCFAARGKMHKLTRSGENHLVFAIVPENARTSVPELERVAALR
ncbi:cell division protein SepF [Corynebacterium aquatimens]|uniref:Cell division protein SepF n=1 Tax=Corynebacterium aquatimens TaxID=1190508 RepID=A0A931E152_9CORY|nr:cell division protein SepF [Corynebacterium aquatimens]MBG6121957.1 cell division inhibitor SepF [Corynebacterium aquatimens]WJY65504.1 Cell division protein SepF [Corynebacterium aquatimens]